MYAFSLASSYYQRIYKKNGKWKIENVNSKTTSWRKVSVRNVNEFLFLTSHEAKKQMRLDSELKILRFDLYLQNKCVKENSKKFNR